MCLCFVCALIALKFCLFKQKVHSPLKGCGACVFTAWYECMIHCGNNLTITVAWIMEFTLFSTACCNEVFPLLPLLSNSVKPKRSRLVENQKKKRTEKQHFYTHKKQKKNTFDKNWRCTNACAYTHIYMYCIHVISLEQVLADFLLH